LNERVVRAGAGILFFGVMVSFMNAWLLGNFAPTRVFVVAFLFDFSLRLFVNPRLAPSLVLGQWLVRRQQPEWTGAPQKRFAWAIGFVLALTMFYLVVLRGVIGPINLLVCGTCLLLLFFESAFGICIGCWIYNRFNVEQARLCPGGVCEFEPDPAWRVSPLQWVSVVVLFALMALLAPRLAGQAKGSAPQAAAQPAAQSEQDPAEAERCKVPEFAKAMGHEAKWKLHNGCQ
ncbi:MAG: DUF4395 domain-containing protein, partial [Limnohabitans sp.]